MFKWKRTFLIGSGILIVGAVWALLNELRIIKEISSLDGVVFSEWSAQYSCLDWILSANFDKTCRPFYRPSEITIKSIPKNPEAVARLIRRIRTAKIVHISAEYVQIPDVLLDSLPLESIKSLAITSARLSRVGWENLARASSLELLVLDDNDLSDEEFQSFIGKLVRLRKLMLFGNPVSDQSAKLVISLPVLSEFWVEDCNFTIDTLSRLKVQLARVEIFVNGSSVF